MGLAARHSGGSQTAPPTDVVRDNGRVARLTHAPSGCVDENEVTTQTKERLAPRAASGPSYMTAALHRWRRRTDTPLVVLAVGSLPLLLLELARGRLSPGDRVFLDVVNIVVLIAFAIDYTVELSVARERHRYVRREWSSALIVIGQAMALVPSLAGFGVLRILRAGRLIGVIARLFAIGLAASREGRTILRRNAVAFAFGLAAFTCVTSAVAFTLAEDVGEHRRVHSLFDALWWSFATVTTVGYGDIAPVTAVGRLVGAVTVVVGISTFAVVTAKVAEFLIRVDREDKQVAYPDVLLAVSARCVRGAPVSCFELEPIA
jgi:voltage-gated potassium channel